MREFLASVNYNAWVLTALLGLPLLGAALILLASPAMRRREAARTDAEFRGARSVALITLLLEFVVSLGLWWSYEPDAPGWQAVADLP